MKRSIPISLLLLTTFPAYGQPRSFGSYGLPQSRLEARYGLEATAAVERCPPQVANRLSVFIESGEIDWLPKPVETLRAITRHGPVIAEFVMDNAKVLAKDQDAFEAFLADPVEIAYRRRSLTAAAAAVKAAREAPPPWWNVRADAASAFVLGIGLVAGLLGGIALVRRSGRPREPRSASHSAHTHSPTEPGSSASTDKSKADALRAAGEHLLKRAAKEEQAQQSAHPTPRRRAPRRF